MRGGGSPTPGVWDERLARVGTDYTTLYCDIGVSLVGWSCGSIGEKALLHCKIGIAWIVLWHQK